MESITCSMKKKHRPKRYIKISVIVLLFTSPEVLFYTTNGRWISFWQSIKNILSYWNLSSLDSNIAFIYVLQRNIYHKIQANLINNKIKAVVPFPRNSFKDLQRDPKLQTLSLKDNSVAASRGNSHHFMNAESSLVCWQQPFHWCLLWAIFVQSKTFSRFSLTATLNIIFSFTSWFSSHFPSASQQNFLSISLLSFCYMRWS